MGDADIGKLEWLIPSHSEGALSTISMASL
jgi:hypothetical protein